jgi:hypothetical protein
VGIESIKENHLTMIRTDQKSIVEQIFIPFSDISSQFREEYIYTGEEKIPFKERHPVFRDLMLGEFGNH